MIGCFDTADTMLPGPVKLVSTLMGDCPIKCIPSHYERLSLVLFLKMELHNIIIMIFLNLISGPTVYFGGQLVPSANASSQTSGFSFPVLHPELKLCTHALTRMHFWVSDRKTAALKSDFCLELGNRHHGLVQAFLSQHQPICQSTGLANISSLLAPSNLPVAQSDRLCWPFFQTNKTVQDAFNQNTMQMLYLRMDIYLHCSIWLN